MISANNGMGLSSKIYVAGHQGLVGSALMKRLSSAGYTNLVTRTHRDLDLTEETAVRTFFEQESPEYVFLAAAKVGGILANNKYPAEFIHQNLSIQNRVIHECWRTGVKRLLFLGSSCIYPRECQQPIKEEYFLTGPLEATNRPYALAKIAGVEMCWAYNRQYGTQYIAAMPTNLYGPEDNFDLEKSHVLPALIRKMHDARVSRHSDVVVWGTGTPRREFLYSEDMAEACVFIMKLPDAVLAPLLTGENTAPLVNIGFGEDITILELARMVARVLGFHGNIAFDNSKPDGTPRKLLDNSRLRSMGWPGPSTRLENGIQKSYQYFLKTQLTISQI